MTRADLNLWGWAILAILALMLLPAEERHCREWRPAYVDRETGASGPIVCVEWFKTD